MTLKFPNFATIVAGLGGAAGITGLVCLFIGNTAEKVMDALSCDLLVVKPPHFASRVPRARRGVLFATLAPVS